jgi:hypothetical protein
MRRVRQSKRTGTNVHVKPSDVRDRVEKFLSRLLVIGMHRRPRLLGKKQHRSSPSPAPAQGTCTCTTSPSTAGSSKPFKNRADSTRAAPTRRGLRLASLCNAGWPKRTKRRLPPARPTICLATTILAVSASLRHFVSFPKAEPGL